MTDDVRRASDAPLPGGSFQLLVQRFGYQALMNLGVLENPVTASRTVNLDQARVVLEDLVMLREKTEGNLDEAEREHLDRVIDELRGRYREVAESR